MSPEIPYVGTELDVFATAATWKGYWQSLAAPFLRGDVLDVGAGLGANLALMSFSATQSWVCLEPDPILSQRLQQQVNLIDGQRECRVLTGTVADLSADALFDAVLYIDVLEHIEDDLSELRRTAAHLRPGGVLVILVPAHPSLYSAFDAAVGHYRRYTKATLSRAIPHDFEQEVLLSLDSVGLLASLVNRLVLGQAIPTARQIAFWDGVLVRLSKVVDPLVRHSLGKSLLGVWRKPQLVSDALMGPGHDD
jgi:SAM-dependent methyltransferase